MASKSKKRRRVFRASCILAALIIAGSSFAWFTSSDEVTNRLSASADYGTKIVESYAPPKNWLPGQEVNKDVYATNTGTIGAFVREDVSGTLTVTKDIATTAKTANSIKLTPEERYAVEAGAYLAYKPSGSAADLGDQIVIRPADKAGSPSLTDFTPDVEGLYVFRRSIEVDGSAGEAFEYDGYYFDGTDFYKISNLNVVQDAAADKAADGKKTDGTLAAASAGFWEEKTTVADPVALRYEESPDADHTGKYLIAEYDTGNYIKEADFAAASNAYDQAIHNYQYLTALANAATTEATAAGTGTGALGAAQTALTDAEDDLDQAVTDLQTAAAALATAQTTYNRAVADEAYAAQKVKEAKIALYGDNGTGEPNAPGSASADSLLSKKNAAATALGSATADDNGRFEAEIDAWFADQQNVPGTEANKIYNNGTVSSVDAGDLSVAALEEFADWVAGQEGHDFYTLTAANKIAVKKYEDAMTELYGHANGGESGETTGNEVNKYTTGSLYGKWKTADAAKTAASTTLGDETDAADAAGSAWAQYNHAKDALATAKTGYETAYSDWYDAYVASQAANDRRDELVAAAAAADQAMQAAEQAMQAAEQAMNAANATDGILKIYIKLADNVNTTGDAEAWQLLPNPVTNDTAIFYYKSILEGGETSAKLIDSVELDKNATQDMYKYFDFDLNVALKSAQITYADDNETILATATPSELDAVATLTDATEIDTEITWS